jgi:predicted transcriptional regulator
MPDTTLTDKDAADSSDLIRYAVDIVASYISNHHVPISDLPATIRSVYEGLAGNAAPERNIAGSQKPAVPIKRSITPEYLICLEDGAKLKMLKRYLRTRFGMDPKEYRAKWSLPNDYPMVAPNYSEVRSGLAKKSGLGKTGAKSTGKKRKKS